MKLTQQLAEYVAAAFSGIWIETAEPDEAEREIIQFVQQQGIGVYIWDIARGSHESGLGSQDPLAPLKVKDIGQLTLLVVLHNYHRFLQNPIVVQTLFNAVIAGKADRVFYIILSPAVQLPPELEKVFVVLEHPLPDYNDLRDIAAELEGDAAQANPCDLSNSARASAGLTRYEAEGAFALSMARKQAVYPSTVWELKAQMLKKSGLLTLHRGKEKFDDLGGLEALKQFCKRAIRHSNGVRARGCLLLGVPGTGKSAFAKALGHETGRPTLILDVGGLMGSLVGQTENNVRQALRIADAMAPCILFIDECEKALSGLQSSGQTDSGVTARLFGTLLTWLNDHESDVFTVCTCNDISKLPPEFSRAERFDGVFFIDLPSIRERCIIWDLYSRTYGKKIENVRPDLGILDEGWTGAEIRSCCRLAALLDCSIVEAAQYIVPVATIASDKVSTLREWASNRTIDASRGGLYHHNRGE